MKVLVACESSGTVRDAFRRLGHDAWSCDLLAADDDSQYHIKGDACKAIRRGWDIVISHPPCTHLSSSGARWWAEKQADGRQQEAIEFFCQVAALSRSNASSYAIENPVGLMSSVFRKPDQIIHPWQYGHGETKATCLWLHNLPLLQPTNVVAGREARIHRLPPSKDRWKIRSKTYQGIADAMAQQWGLRTNDQDQRRV